MKMCPDILCPLCNISTFPDIESFKLNLIKVSSKPIKCPLCPDVLLGLDKLTIHLFGHSIPFEMDDPKSPLTLQEKPPLKVPKKTSKRQECCNIKLVKISSLTQNSQSIDEKFRCDICGFLFEEKYLLDLHLNLVHNFTLNNVDNNEKDEETQSSVTKWNCHLCGKHFKMKGALRIHIRVAHMKFHDQNQRQINIADYLKNQNSIDTCTIKTEMLSLQDQCSPDSSPYYSKSPQSSPIHTSSCSYVPKSPTNNNEQLKSPQESATKTSKTFQCEECKKNFTTKYFLKKHKRLHTGEMPYKCEIEGCGKMFHFQQSYHKHLLYHSDAKPYECSECGRSFKELSTLHNHQRIHSGIKPFGCHICGKFFRQKVSYLVHQRIHNGVLPYKCSECGKGFRYKVSQRSHKCSGVLERQPGSLIQKLMQNSSILATSTVVSSETTTIPTATNNASISTIDQKQSENETTHDLCLDDLLKESYEKLMKPSENENQLLPQMVGDNAFESNTGVMTFDNGMPTNSNYNSNSSNTSNIFNMNFHSTLETICEDSIKELLFGHVG